MPSTGYLTQWHILIVFRDSSGCAESESKILEIVESEQAWEEMSHGKDFAITDWMIQ